jgi:hypothetical protein
MRRRFGRGRKTRPAGDARNAPIDAARWLGRIVEAGIVATRSLEPVDAEDVPASFAVLGIGETDEGSRLLVGFAPKSGADAALAVAAHGRRLAAQDGFEGEAVARGAAWRCWASSRSASRPWPRRDWPRTEAPSRWRRPRRSW